MQASPAVWAATWAEKEAGPQAAHACNTAHTHDRNQYTKQAFQALTATTQAQKGAGTHSKHGVYDCNTEHNLCVTQPVASQAS